MFCWDLLIINGIIYYLYTTQTADNYLAIKRDLNTFQNIHKRNIEETKRKYYENIFFKYKNDIKNTWDTIKQTLNRQNLNNDNYR